MSRWVLLVGLLAACSNDSTTPAGPTLLVTNHAFYQNCNPVCDPITAVKSLTISVRVTADSLNAVASVGQGKTVCIDITDSVAYVYAYAPAAGLLAPDSEPVNFATSWRWVVRDTLFNGGILQPSPSTFTVSSACR